MVEPSTQKYEVDPFVAIHVREAIKPLADEEVSLYTNPASIVQQLDDGLKRLTCHPCKSIAIDAVYEANCGHCFCRTCS